MSRFSEAYDVDELKEPLRAGSVLGHKIMSGNRASIGSESLAMSDADRFSEAFPTDELKQPLDLGQTSVDPRLGSSYDTGGGGVPTRSGAVRHNAPKSKHESKRSSGSFSSLVDTLFGCSCDASTCVPDPTDKPGEFQNSRLAKVRQSSIASIQSTSTQNSQNSAAVVHTTRLRYDSGGCDDRFEFEKKHSFDDRKKTSTEITLGGGGAGKIPVVVEIHPGFVNDLPELSAPICPIEQVAIAAELICYFKCQWKNNPGQQEFWKSRNLVLKNAQAQTLAPGKRISEIQQNVDGFIYLHLSLETRVEDTLHPIKSLNSEIMKLTLVDMAKQTKKQAHSVKTKEMWQKGQEVTYKGKLENREVQFDPDNGVKIDEKWFVHREGEGWFLNSDKASIQAMNKAFGLDDNRQLSYNEVCPVDDFEHEKFSPEVFATNVQNKGFALLGIKIRPVVHAVVSAPRLNSKKSNICKVCGFEPNGVATFHKCYEDKEKKYRTNKVYITNLDDAEGISMPARMLTIVPESFKDIPEPPASRRSSFIKQSYQKEASKSTGKGRRSKRRAGPSTDDDEDYSDAVTAWSRGDEDISEGELFAQPSSVIKPTDPAANTGHHRKSSSLSSFSLSTSDVHELGGEDLFS
jgi:hypothetical protein